MKLILNKMGARQIKCSCGEDSTYKIILESEILDSNPFIALTTLGEMAGKRGWSTGITKDGKLSFNACLCEPCKDNLRIILDKLDHVTYDITFSREGWWKMDLT